MNKATPPTNDEIDLLDLIHVLVDNLRLLVFAPLIIGLLALGICFFVPPTYTATTVFVPPQQQQNAVAAMLGGLGALGGLAGAATGIKNPNDQYVSFLKSDAIANGLIERFKLMQRYEAELKADARKSLESVSKITSGKDGLITIEVDDRDPKFAAQLANGYVDELNRLLDRLAVTEAKQRRVFFEKQLAQTKENLAKAEVALRASGVNGTAFKSSPEAAIKAVAELQAQIAVQEIKLGSMRGYLTENAPDFKQALTELSALKQQFAKLEKNTNKESGADTDYVSRFRDVKYFEAMFEMFSKQFELAKVDEAREGAEIQVVDFAEVPERKSKPKKALVAIMATFASGLLLTIFVFMRNSISTGKSNPESAEKLGRIRKAWNKAIGRNNANS